MLDFLTIFIKKTISVFDRMVYDWHYIIFIYYTPFIILFGVIYALLSRIFPEQRKVAIIIVLAISALGTGYMVETGLAEALFLDFVGKSAEVIGIAGFLILLLAFLGIKAGFSLKSKFDKLGFLMVFSLIVLWIVQKTMFEKMGTPVFKFIFILSLFIFLYLVFKKLIGNIYKPK